MPCGGLSKTIHSAGGRSDRKAMSFPRFASHHQPPPIANRTAARAAAVQRSGCLAKAEIKLSWLSDLDSNQDKSLQRALCYHYTIGQSAPKIPARRDRRKEKVTRPMLVKSSAFPGSV